MYVHAAMHLWNNNLVTLRDRVATTTVLALLEAQLGQVVNFTSRPGLVSTPKM